MTATDACAPADDAAPVGWHVERIDDSTLRVACPYFSTPVVLTVDHPDRGHRALFNLMADVLALPAAWQPGDRGQQPAPPMSTLRTVGTTHTRR